MSRSETFTLTFHHLLNTPFNTSSGVAIGVILRNLLATPSSSTLLNSNSFLLFLFHFGYSALEVREKNAELMLFPPLLALLTLLENFENSLLLTLPFDICETTEEVDENAENTEEEIDVKGDIDFLVDVERETEGLGVVDITELTTLLLTPLLTLLLTNPELLTAFESEVKALLTAGDVV